MAELPESATVRTVKDEDSLVQKVEAFVPPD